MGLSESKRLMLPIIGRLGTTSAEPMVARNRESGLRKLYGTNTHKLILVFNEIRGNLDLYPR